MRYHPSPSPRIFAGDPYARPIHALPRLSKLATRLIPPAQPAPPEPNPFADWSAHLFTGNRANCIIVKNTPSLYSTILIGQELTAHFLDRTVSAIREVMIADDLESIYHPHIAPTTDRVHYATALNRSVIGSMNELICEARCG